MDAGFVHVVEVEQYFMTKDIGDFTKFHTVACRDTLFQEMITTKRMDSGKLENWTCIGSHDQLSVR